MKTKTAEPTVNRIVTNPGEVVAIVYLPEMVHELMESAKDLLVKIDHMTSEDFAFGKDVVERENLRNAIDTLEKALCR